MRALVCILLLLLVLLGWYTLTRPAHAHSARFWLYSGPTNTPTATPTSTQTPTPTPTSGFVFDVIQLS